MRKYPHFQDFVPPDVPQVELGFHDTPLDAERQKPLIFQRLGLTFWTVMDVAESENGRHDWIRTSDLFRVKEAL
jgi:hypothetical protein